MSVATRSTILAVLMTALLAAGLSTLRGFDDKSQGPLDRRHYLSEEDAAWIRPGLVLEILDVSIPADRKPVVVFRLTDNGAQPLDRAGILTPGSITTTFVFSYLPVDGDQYVSYITRSVRSSITNVTTNQPTGDSGGAYTVRGDGIYQYTFGNALPSGYDRTATHTLGIYATRELREWGLSRYVANTLKSFVPDGRPVAKIREVVATANCNQCHNPLALHGGARQDTRICILCHTPQAMDPDTGNTVDFKVMIHKIHRGENLPSVEAGKPYQIIGFGQSIHDYSHVAFPRDIRNCTTCHKNSGQADNWLLKPSMAVCGACHDDVDFKTGQHHPGGPQPDDRNCARCHWPESGFENDSTIAGAHTVPYRSAQLRRPKFEILSVTGTGAGQKPTVRFRIADKDNRPIAPSAMARIALRLAGPTTDYSWFLSESAANATYVDGLSTYTFAGSLPAGATGTYDVGIEGYLNTTVNPGTEKAYAYRDAGDNVVKSFAVTGTERPRRAVVDIANCNRCHDKLQLHGNNRNQTAYCVGCHNPTMTDSARRPAAANPPESIHFKYMIHRIHTGHELTGDFTVYGFGNTPINFNHLGFPGDRRDCTTCHVGTSYTLPLPGGLLPTASPRGFWSPTQPVAAACLGCHDSVEAAAHAFVNTAIFGESCNVCHGESAKFAVSRMHAR